MMAVAVLPASLSVDLLKSTGFKSKCRLRVAAASVHVHACAWMQQTSE